MSGRFFLFFILSFLFFQRTFAQTNTVDSLKLALQNADHDTTRCDAYIQWGEAIYLAFPDSSLSLWKKAEALCEKNISQDKNNKRAYLLRLANVLSDMGTVYHHQGRISGALEYLHKSLKVCEEINEKAAISITLNNIGAIYFDQGDYTKALDCYQKSLKINQELDDKRWIGNLMNNIASIYDQQGDQAKALEYLKEGLKNYESIGHTRGIASSLHNIAGVYRDQNNDEMALEYYTRSLKIREELSDMEGVAAVYNSIASLKLGKGKTEEALGYATKGMLTAKGVGFPGVISRSASILKRIFLIQNKYKDAYEMYELEIKMKDSLLNEETQKATLKKQLQYDYEKKEAVAEAVHKKELESQQEIANEKSRKQAIVTWSVVGGLLLVLFFAAFIFRSLNLTRKQKRLIEIQKTVVEQQKHLVEEHQKEIIDSIMYARRIQQSLLPGEKYIERTLKRLNK